MGRDKSRRLSGSRHFRQPLVLATLTSTAITIEDIRSEDAAPGLRPYEVSLLRLLDKISDHHTVDLNETGTKLRYRPGVIVGGKGLEHDCGVHRGIGYFLEPLILLGLFSRAPISIRLKGSFFVVVGESLIEVDIFRLLAARSCSLFVKLVVCNTIHLA